MQRCSVEVVGLESKPQLNGMGGEISGFDEDLVSRYSVTRLTETKIASSCSDLVDQIFDGFLALDFYRGLPGASPRPLDSFQPTFSKMCQGQEGKPTRKAIQSTKT